jgi:hypothetical protein
MDDKNKMNKPGRGNLPALIAVTIGILLCMPILGLVCGLGYFGAESSGAFERWQALGTPPERATKILAFRYKLYVKTIGDRVYSCDESSRTECWMESTLPPETSTPDELPCDGAHFQVPNPPSKVVDSLESQVCGVETVSQHNFVLLEDGSIWMWHHNFTVYDLLFFPFCGLVLGLLSGVAISILVWRRQWKRSGGKRGAL